MLMDSGNLLGVSLSNYIGNFCSKVFIGIVQGWWYIYWHLIKAIIGSNGEKRKEKILELLYIKIVL
jgi:hypothetical protein